MRQRHAAARCLLVLALCAWLPAHATWSIAAVNPRTGTIGVAAASCSGGVYGIQAVVPGKGAVIVQAESSGQARRAAVAMLREGASPDAILARISDPASGFAPGRQQYAVLASGPDARPRTYTGAEVPGFKGAAGGEHVSVQANTMASADVVPRTAAALGEADWPDDLAMARALMRALQAGADAGGDRRCGKAASNTAFVSLHRRTDADDAPWMELAVNRIPVGAASGTAALRALFDDWLRRGTRRASTRTFVVPATGATPPAH